MLRLLRETLFILRLYVSNYCLKSWVTKRDATPQEKWSCGGILSFACYSGIFSSWGFHSQNSRSNYFTVDLVVFFF